LADVAATGARRSRRAAAQFLLARAARRSTISARLEGERLEESLSRLKKLREEEERLALFEKQAGKPREDVRKELDRRLAILQDLYLRQSVLESSPERADGVGALEPEAPDRPSETASHVLSESDLDPVDGVDERVKTYPEMGATGMAGTLGRATSASSRRLAAPLHGPRPPLPAPDRRRQQVSLSPDTLIRAVAPGKVLHAGPFKSLGHTVVVEIEGGMTTVYACLGPDIGVELGQTVKKGQILGSAGLIRNAGQSVDGVNAGVQFEVRDKEGDLVHLSRIPGLSASNLRNLLTGATE
jgi:murein DD-endopeptidase MepM/ murein hydrolase activator NlpD